MKPVSVVAVVPKNAPMMYMIKRRCLQPWLFIRMGALIAAMDAVIYVQVDQLPIAVMIPIGYLQTANVWRFIPSNPAREGIEVIKKRPKLTTTILVIFYAFNPVVGDNKMLHYSHNEVNRGH